MAIAEVSDQGGNLQMFGPIDARYAGLGGDAGTLGPPVVAETDAAGGRFRHYRGGSTYWSPASGAHDVRGGIREAWGRLGWERSGLGYPVTGDARAGDGVGFFNHFQGGTIIWGPASGAHDVRGAIRDTWAQLGWEKSALGYPVTGDGRTGDRLGYFNHFQNGTIIWGPATGAREVRGAIRDRWAGTGWEQGPLGYPVSNQYDVPGGKRNDFQRGSIIWDARTGQTTIL